VTALASCRAAALAPALALAMLPGCERPETDGDAAAPAERGAPARASAVTFTRDVAPIVFEHCVPCHQPRGAGPFPLVTFDDVRKHASQIVAVTASGFMPPWLPAPDHVAFVGERRLDGRQLSVLREWSAAGAPEGDPADLPAVPRMADGWQLGPPDMVVTLPETFTLPAGGADVFRNFVVPVPLAAPRYVRAVELRPGNQQIVHHAIVMVDPTRQARRLDAADPGPGYAGMDSRYGQAPDGHFLGWTPGRVPDAGSGGVPWRLDAGTDLVLQLHMVPSGKPEPIRPSIGLHFGDPPRTAARTMTVYMKAEVDIPPGATEYVALDRFALPVDSVAEQVYPHAHYLGKSIAAFATLPDGSARPLIRIDDWDFSWQDSYRFVEPVALPAGSVITMRWTYDNSTANVRNPSNPPRRVVSGNSTTDEMAHLYLQLRVRDEADRLRLAIAEAQHRLEQSPNDWALHTSLAGSLQAAGRLDEAADHCNRALALKADYAPAHYCLGLVRELQDSPDRAAQHYGEAVRLDPGNPLLRTSLAEVLVRLGRLQEADEQLRIAIEADPRIGDTHTLLGNVRRMQGRIPEAISAYEAAVAAHQDDVRAHAYLGALLAERGELDRAAVHLEQAVRLAPDTASLRVTLGRVLIAAGRTAEATEQLRAALALDPGHAEARARLQALQGGSQP
jgi:Flp pilus assembly protein TadD